MFPRIIIAALLVVLVPASKSLAQEVARTTAASTAIPSALSDPASTNQATSLSFKLKPTAIAPAGAEGSAEIKSGSIALHLNAVGQGRYVVQVFRKSNGAVEKLGAINIIDATLTPSARATDNKKEASANPEMVALQTDTTMTLPRTMSDRDISRIQVIAQNGNAVLDSAAK